MVSTIDSMSSIYRTLGRAALEGAVLKGALLKGPVLKGLLLRGADLKCAVRKGVVLKAAVLRDIALACLAVLFIGLSYGAIAVASGVPVWVPAAQSVLVLAGASEFLFIGIVAAGGNPIAAALAGLLVNARHLPYGLALPDITGPEVTGPGGGWRRLLGTHLMNDESVVFALAHDELPP